MEEPRCLRSSWSAGSGAACVDSSCKPHCATVTFWVLALHPPQCLSAGTTVPARDMRPCLRTSPLVTLEGGGRSRPELLLSALRAQDGARAESPAHGAAGTSGSPRPRRAHPRGPGGEAPRPGPWAHCTVPKGTPFSGTFSTLASSIGSTASMKPVCFRVKSCGVPRLPGLLAAVRWLPSRGLFSPGGSSSSPDCVASPPVLALPLTAGLPARPGPQGASSRPHQAPGRPTRGDRQTFLLCTASASLSRVICIYSESHFLRSPRFSRAQLPARFSPLFISASHFPH